MSEFKPTKLNYSFVKDKELIAEAKGRGLLNENEQYVRKDVIELLKEWDTEHADQFGNDAGADELNKDTELKYKKYQDEYLKEKNYTIEQVLSNSELLDEMNKYIADKMIVKYEFNCKEITKEKYNQLKRAGLIE